MSGIVALIHEDGSPVDRGLLRKLNAFQAFRGPDGQHEWSEDAVGLGHARHRHPEHQPRTLDGRVWITADARIDGRPELVARLGRCEDHSGDAELILHAYQAWGDDCVGHLIGDFAFILWDAARRRLLCAVDHFGVRPLYYAHQGNRLILSNTLECVRRHPQVSSRLDDRAVGDFLLFQHYQDREQTIDAEIRRLPPAHAMIWEDGRLRLVRYWSFPPEPDPPALAKDAVEQLDELLTHAVGDRLRGRPVGVFFSGGIDSPLIADAARRILDRHGDADALHAHTVVYDHLIPDQERHFSGLAARALGIAQHVYTADEFGLYDWIDRPDCAPPEPVNDPCFDWSIRFHRAVALTCQVALTGYDGDCLLASTPSLHWKRLVRARQCGRLALEWGWYLFDQRRPPPIGFRNTLRRLRKRKVPPPLPVWLDPAFVKRADLANRWAHYHRSEKLPGPRGPARDQLASALWAGLFDSYDPGWTGSTLEVSHPLMDVRLVTFLMNLPAVPWCIDKELFRRSLREKVPLEVSRRPKTPLLQDPIVVKLRKGEMSLTLRNNLDYDSLLSHYVNVDRLIVPTAISAIDEIYRWLTPISLYAWLRCRGRKAEHA